MSENLVEGKQMVDGSVPAFEVLLTRGAELLITFQRKEQLPRKFVPQDFADLRGFEAQLQEFMQGMGPAGQQFIDNWQGSNIVIIEEGTEGTGINTRDLKRCLKLMIEFKDVHIDSA
jgi:hypothetical protein